jgi:nucleotidyltransferase substrate binding protein (TIGR01987 family)
MNQPFDIRWQQRFANYRKALARLTEAVELRRQRPFTDLERQGLIQAFEFTHELAWNTFKDIAEFQGASGLLGSRDATRYAFKTGLIEDGENWMKMIDSRNLSTHTYQEAVAQELEQRIIDSYFALFGQSVARLTEHLDAD